MSEEIKEQENPLSKPKAGRPPKPVKAFVEAAPEVSKVDEDEKVLVSLKEIKALIAESKASDSQNLSKAIVQGLAEALSELKKPYVDPKKEENEKTFAEQSRIQQERLRRSLEIDRQNCPHMQGSNLLSEEQGTRTCIWWHKLDSGTRWGICSNCQREFWPSDPDYRYWLSRPKGNPKSSAAGERQFVDTKAWEDKEHPLPFGSATGRKPSLPAEISQPIWS